MKNVDLLLIGGMLLMVVVSAGFLLQQSFTGEAIAAPLNYRALAVAPYTDLPYDNEPIEMPFAGRCYRDEGAVVIFQHVVDQDVGRAFDGCFEAGDGEFYDYNYYCVGTPKMSQLWLRISPGCNKQ